MTTPSEEYIRFICSLYNDIYDDRIEDSRPPAVGNQLCIPGEDWKHQYTGNGVASDSAVKRIAEELKISRVSVSVNLPYSSVVYKLESCSSNAKRCAKYKTGLLERQKTEKKMCSLAEK